MSDLEKAYSALRNADAAGDIEGARKLASYIRSQRQQTAEQPTQQPKRQVGAGEAFGRGLGTAYAKTGNMLTMAAGGAGVIADSIGNLITGNDSTYLQDKAFKYLVDPTREAIEYYEPKANEEMGLGATVANIGGNLAGIVQQAAATGVGGAINGTTNLLKAAVASRAPIEAAKIAAPAFGQATASVLPSYALPESVSRSQDLIDNGVDVDTAMKAYGTNTIANTLMGVAPIGLAGNVGKRILTGGALGAGTGAAGRALEGEVLGDEFADQALDPFSVRDSSLEAGIGSIMSALLGRRGAAVSNRVSDNSPSNQDTPSYNLVTEPNVESSIADIISQVTGAPQTANSPVDAVRNTVEADAAAKKARAEFYKGELAKQVSMYGDELPPQFNETPNSQDAAVRQAYEAQGIDPNSIAMAFERGRTVNEEKLPPEQRQITQQQNNDAFAKRAFDIAALRQGRADGDLADNGTIAPDYVGGLAAYSGGTINGDERAVYMVGERSFEPLRDERTGETIRDNKGNIIGTFTDVDGNKSNGIANQRQIKVFTSPANPRQAQDFMAQSSQPRAGVGEGTMQQERMPRRSTDRISGDVFGGQATRNLGDPYTPEPRSPMGDIDVEQAPQRGTLNAPRQTDTIDQVNQGTGVSTVAGEVVRTPFDRTIDNTPRLDNKTSNPSNRLPSPDSESPTGANSGRMVVDNNGVVRAEKESYQQQNSRVEAERVQKSIDDYSRNELGNTAKNVGTTDTKKYPVARVEPEDSKDAFKRNQGKHPVDDRLNSDTYVGLLESYAQGAGWATVGGKIIRDPETGDVSGRTSWQGKEDWWQKAPKFLRAGDGVFFRNAVNKSLTGDKLTPNEKAAVKWVLDHADAEMRDADVSLLGKELGFSPFVLEGRKVTLDVDVGGRKVSVEQDATTALYEAKTRIDSLRQLMDCLG